MKYWLFKDKWTDKDGNEHGKVQCAVCGRKIVAAVRFDEDSGKACCDRPECTSKWDLEVMKRDDPDGYAKKMQEVADMEADAAKIKSTVIDKSLEEEAEEVRKRNKL